MAVRVMTLSAFLPILMPRCYGKKEKHVAELKLDHALTYSMPPSALANVVEGTSKATRSDHSHPVLYLVNRYPGISHTFIRREIQALEALGLPVIRTSIRSGGDLVDPLDQAEERITDRLLDSKKRLAAALPWALFSRPAGFFHALADMVRMMRRSDRSMIRHAICVIEACALARKVRQQSARHIHAHFGTNSTEVAMFAATIAGCSFSFTVHGCEEYDKPEALGLRLKIARARFVVAVSYFGRAQLLRWCRAEDRVKVQLVRCGLDRSSFETPDKASPSYPARFVCVARLCAEKALTTLLEACAILVREGQPFELVIVGDGEMRDELEAMIRVKSLSAHVRITGWMDGPAVRREIEASRALVMSSFAENLPVVIMEAMALRRPVIATAVGGIAELVAAYETGWLVPPGSPEDIAKAMSACLDAPDSEIARMGENGRMRVIRNHDAAKEAGKLALLLEAAVSP
jgi:colanic acid/amylovoran biosynthesis glycosyltransferase